MFCYEFLDFPPLLGFMLHSKRRNRRVKEQDKCGITEDRRASSWADQSGVTEGPQVDQCPEHGSSTPVFPQPKSRAYPAAAQPLYNNFLPQGRKKEIAETILTWVSQCYLIIFNYTFINVTLQELLGYIVSVF